MSELPGEVISFMHMADYYAAIAAAPPNTMIKMGDLERPKVKCTTCSALMEMAAVPFHKHPRDCEHCHKTYDENTHKHTAIQASKHCGAGTVTYTAGCQEEAL